LGDLFLAKQLGWTLNELWELDIQTIADVRTILRYEADVRAAMEPQGGKPVG
jgi:hypothetical protein